MIQKIGKRINGYLQGKFFNNRKWQKNLVDHFHNLYYHSLNTTWNETHWFGVKTLKCPLDLWIYQELLYKLKPDLIIETGTFNGGSAFYLANICDLLNKGKVVTVDIEDKPGRPVHPRVTYIKGSSTDSEILSKVKSHIQEGFTVMVILDSDHSRDHVLKEMQLYHSFVTKGSYMVVEDTNVNGHPVHQSHGPGPMEALNEFLKKNQDFVIDKTQEKFFLTFNPNGFLKKVK